MGRRSLYGGWGGGWMLDGNCAGGEVFGGLKGENHSSLSVRRHFLEQNFRNIALVRGSPLAGEDL